MSIFTGNNKNEVFVGNIDSKIGIPTHLKGLKSIRLGSVALDLNGKKINDMLPIFIDRNEIGSHDRIMMQRMSKYNR